MANTFDDLENRNSFSNWVRQTSLKGGSKEWSILIDELEFTWQGKLILEIVIQKHASKMIWNGMPRESAIRSWISGR